MRHEEERYQVVLWWAWFKMTPLGMLSSSSSLSPLSLSRCSSFVERCCRCRPTSSFLRPFLFFPASPSKKFGFFRPFCSMTSVPKESASNNPGLQEEPDKATKGYIMQQTMFRIKDPKVSLDFYSRVLGMKLLKRLDFPEMKFSLYFMGYEDTLVAPTDPAQRTVWTFSRKATIELTQ